MGPTKSVHNKKLITLIVVTLSNIHCSPQLFLNNVCSNCSKGSPLVQKELISWERGPAGKTPCLSGWKQGVRIATEWNGPSFFLAFIANFK